jgi:hypothetical protein
MTIPTPPHAALDGILRRARHLLLEIDGAVCTLYARKAASLAADELRAILAEQAADIPAAITATADPLAVLAYAAAVSPEHRRTGRSRADPVRTRRCRHSPGRRIQPRRHQQRPRRSPHRRRHQTCSAQAVHAYLDRTSLDELVGLVIGRTGSAAEDDLIGRALSALSADPATCALVARSPAVLNRATAIGVATIAYAPTPATPNLPAAAIGATVTSLADLVLRLRAHPLPN